MLLPAVGGFPRRPKVLLAVGELFVRARSARSQARSACVIARRRLALPPRGTKTSTPTAEGRWGAANLSAKPKVRRPPQALAAKPLVYHNLLALENYFQNLMARHVQFYNAPKKSIFRNHIGNLKKQVTKFIKNHTKYVHHKH